MANKFAVLGCGPAGMMVAHACAREGANFDIISDKIDKSTIGGAQYLHIPIPGLTEPDPDGTIMVIKRGTAGGYASKVNRTGHDTSWSKFEHGLLGVWNLQAAYDNLWARYCPRLVDWKLNEASLQDLEEEYDVILSTIPKSIFCTKPGQHQFTMQPVWIRTGDDLGVPADCMIYDGTQDMPWYRASNIFGSQSKEYPYGLANYPEARRISKPLYNDCDCHPEVFRFGRYGQWEKGWLTSDAYTSATTVVRTIVGGLLPEHG